MTVLALTGAYWIKRTEIATAIRVMYSIDPTSEALIIHTIGANLIADKLHTAYGRESPSPVFVSLSRINTSTNSIEFTKAYSDPVANPSFTGCTFNNTHVVVSKHLTSSKTLYVAKFDLSNYSQIWGSSLVINTATETMNPFAWGSMDSQGNVITAIRARTSPNTTPAFHHIAKLNSADGTKLWERTISGTYIARFSSQPFDICVDSLDNIVTAHIVNTVALSPGGFLIEKLDPNGAVIFSTVYEPPIRSYGYINVKSDSSNNIYVSISGTDVAGSIYQSCIIKFDSSGTHQWTRVFTVPTFWNIGHNGSVLEVASDGRVFFLDSIYPNDINAWDQLYIAHLDTNGNLIYKLSLINPDYSLYPVLSDGITFSNEQLTIGFYTSDPPTSRTGMSVVIPADGAALGSFVDSLGSGDTFSISALGPDVSMLTSTTTITSTTYTSALTSLLDYASFALTESSFPVTLNLYPFTPA